MAEQEEGDKEERNVFLALAQGPAPPRCLRALDRAFFIFLALFLGVLVLEAAYKLLWPNPGQTAGADCLETSKRRGTGAAITECLLPLNPGGKLASRD
ncbi:small integral membrane protein 40 [Sarcophilus harrisii]